MANPNSQARLGYGAKILMGDGGSPEEFTEIAEIGDFNDGDSIGQIEVTNHQSPGGRKEYIADLIDGDEISFDCNYIPTDPTHDRTTGLQSKLGQRLNFRIQAPGETMGAQFQGLVDKIERQMPVAGVMKLSISVKKTGNVTTYAIS